MIRLHRRRHIKFSEKFGNVECPRINRSTIFFYNFSRSGETFYFNPNRLTPSLETRRYAFLASNGQKHVVDIVTDRYGTSTKAFVFPNGGIKHLPTTVDSSLSSSHTQAHGNANPSSYETRADVEPSSSNNINQQQQRTGSWIAQGFSSFLPNFFMPAAPSIQSTSIVVPFAVVVSPYAHTISVPTLIHNSDKGIDPALINSIFQVPSQENKNNDNHNPSSGNGITTTIQPPPSYTSTTSTTTTTTTTHPPPTSSSTTAAPSTSQRPHHNYYETTKKPSRPNYLPPTSNPVEDIDIRRLHFPSTPSTGNAKREQRNAINCSCCFVFHLDFPEVSPLISFDTRLLTENDDIPLSVPKPSNELLPPFEV